MIRYGLRADTVAVQHLFQTSPVIFFTDQHSMSKYENGKRDGSEHHDHTQRIFPEVK